MSTMNTMVDRLIANIKGKDENMRAAAWLNAYTAGPGAIKPLAMLITNKDIEVARAAKRAMWRIVRHAGRPGADPLRQAVIAELIALCTNEQPAAVVREAVWMLSEIGGDEAVEPVAALLANQELREDARMVLQRIPGNKSLDALKAGLASAPKEFKPNIAQSLRQRGTVVDGIPCRKLVPTKETKIKPVGK